MKGKMKGKGMERGGDEERRWREWGGEIRIRGYKGKWR